MSETIYGSLTAIADLPEWPFDHPSLPRSDWEAGDYVVAEVSPRGEDTDGWFELPGGREVRPMTGDLLVGALSRRFATLEATGTFEAVGDDGVMHLLSDAGCFGKLTSRSRFSPGLMPIRYAGHVMVDGAKSNMSDWVNVVDEPEFDLPVLMIVGTSMSAGKTYAGRVAVRLLKDLGHTVVAAKLTGAGRRRDVVSMGDAGAEHIFDFIDAGLPTTVCPPEQYRSHIGGLLERMNATDATVAVIEAGASPLEPYNGATVVELLGERIAFTILCASDPYAVRGIQDAWDREFDLIAGPTANTAGGVALVAKLAEAPAFDIMKESARPELRTMLVEAFGEGPRR